MKQRLTGQQEAFVRALVQGQGRVNAYRSAYQTGRMTDEAVDKRAYTLLLQEKIRARYQELSGVAGRGEGKREVASADSILEELSSIGLGGTGADDEGAGAPGIRERLKALELLGKHYRLFVQQEKTSGETGVRIFDDIPGD